MKTIKTLVVIALLGVGLIPLVAAQATSKPQTVALQTAIVGQPAPVFKATDIQGNIQDLSALKGKIVVLEWTNHQCPYVRKHYDSGNMQALQQELTDKGVVWLSIVSSAAGKQGNTTIEEAKAIVAQDKIKATARILDADGTIGKLYDAKTTPNMFVIDAKGILTYAGAIDDNPSFRIETIKDAKNFVREAVNALLAQKPVETAQTPPYGCSVKY